MKSRSDKSSPPTAYCLLPTTKMNYFAHGRHFIDQPYLLAGTAVPDWLNVVDRSVRARPARAAAHSAIIPIHVSQP